MANGMHHLQDGAGPVGQAGPGGRAGVSGWLATMRSCMGSKLRQLARNLYFGAIGVVGIESFADETHGLLVMAELRLLDGVFDIEAIAIEEPPASSTLRMPRLSCTSMADCPPTTTSSTPESKRSRAN